MEFVSKIAEIAKLRNDCAIVGVYSNGKLSTSATVVNQHNDNIVTRLIEQKDLRGTLGETLLLSQTNGTSSQRILLLGLGEPGDCTRRQLSQALQAVSKALASLDVKHAALFIDDLQLKNEQDQQLAETVALALLTERYRYDRTKSDKPNLPALKKLTLVSSNRSQTSTFKQGLALGEATATGVNAARELGNLPGNICTPTYLANEAKKLAKKHTKFTAKILDEKQMKELGMGSLLSVSAGSDQPAKLIVIEYKGAPKSKKPYVLVGKGITFDTGGISLKPGAGMDEMKFDMCGAASVMGTMHALQGMNLPINVVAVIAASENMPNGKATKPGDVVTSMAGKTIEVLNTDAEGRLVLCDALTYVERFKPDTVIDVATLTGACVIALGKHASGLYSNNDEFAQELLSAGEQANDRAWHMPLWDDYKQQLNSNFADLANIGGREAGSITAAAFLSHFTEKYTWAHLDIAGTAWLSGGAKGATGRPVPMLLQYLRNKAQG